MKLLIILATLLAFASCTLPHSYKLRPLNQSEAIDHGFLHNYFYADDSQLHKIGDTVTMYGLKSVVLDIR